MHYMMISTLLGTNLHPLHSPFYALYGTTLRHAQLALKLWNGALSLWCIRRSHFGCSLSTLG